ncbi:cbb3-type cytochrome c oxidase subunit II [Horticoccus luteus]|uniref:Cbb3-type cytochrome c oxidase subunit II n=1 Tax=Horticoccus luteus TaxID=2862869 RepID=A0A8F9TXR7_9BACT|nr:cbb3-type cytochrome c oxidase subunit II [Horticoccus luteus]QYM79804.1 cbb3-type cytochrome c oxidase subunit II [Horticoccus luteus]
MFIALGISWAGLVIGTRAQYASLRPHYDDNESASFPQRQAGVAAQGQMVYEDLGCVSCHTQQVRRAGIGSDKARGWGDRQSVARDFLYDSRPQLGNARIGPDLSNYAARAKDSGMTPDRLYAYLYNGHNGMPAYPFLFEKRPIIGERDAHALNVKLPAGFEIAPTRRAEQLVAYLLSLNHTYEFSEAQPVVHGTAEGEGETK